MSLEVSETTTTFFNLPPNFFCNSSIIHVEVKNNGIEITQTFLTKEEDVFVQDRNGNIYEPKEFKDWYIGRGTCGWISLDCFQEDLLYFFHEVNPTDRRKKNSYLLLVYKDYRYTLVKLVNLKLKFNEYP